jgi:hypothetical protein
MSRHLLFDVRADGYLPGDEGLQFEDGCVTISARHPLDASARATITVEISTDDGATWQRAITIRPHTRYVLQHVNITEPMRLRVVVSDYRLGFQLKLLHPYALATL